MQYNSEAMESFHVYFSFSPNNALRQFLLFVFLLYYAIMNLGADLVFVDTVNLFGSLERSICL